VAINGALKLQREKQAEAKKEKEDDEKESKEGLRNLILY
jgi:hypothetical protein